MRKLFSKLLLILLVPLAVAAMNFIIDPLQYYRRADWYLPRFYDQQRFQVPAVARTFEYDTVIVGTSMSENIGIEFLRENYGLRAIRGTFSGSSVFEQRMGLQVALRTGQVENVIWELNYVAFSGPTDVVRDTHAVFPYYLYDDNWWTDFKYLFDPNVIARSWEIITNPLPYNSLMAAHELEILNKWGTWSKFGEDLVREYWDGQEFVKGPGVIEDHSITKTRANLMVNVVPIVEAHPEVKFRFYFPPFSVLEHVSYEREGIFESELIWRSQTYDVLSEFDNVEIYDFQAARDIITNLDLYMDRAHHNMNVTDFVVSEIMQGEQVDRVGILANNREIRNMMNEFRNF